MYAITSCYNNRLENQLEEIERKNLLSSRWLPNDTEIEYAVLLTKQEQLLLQIWKTTQRRLFVLQLKSKYAGVFIFIIATRGYQIFHSFTDGQKIAKKLSLQIKKEIKGIQSLVEEYRACTGTTSGDTLTLSEALDPASIGIRLHQLGSWGAVATGRRREIIDAYLTLCRSNEMLEQDARNCVVFYEQKKQIMACELEHRSKHSDLFSRGATALLSDLMHHVSQRLHQSRNGVTMIHSRIHQQMKEDEYFDNIGSSTSSEDSFDEY